MQSKRPMIHPYIPNSVPAIKEAMLREVKATSIDEFYADCPPELRLSGKMDLPEPILSEYELQRYMQVLLGRNITSGEYLNFRGAGCYQHYVPAVCDEVCQRGEFLSAYSGRPYEDHGRYQALFEYASMMGELLEMDVVSFPTYDGFQSTATALRMAARITGRSTVHVPRALNPDKRAKILDYCQPDMKIEWIDLDLQHGQLNLEHLQAQVSQGTAAVYFENPSYLGSLETQGEAISQIAHQLGALSVVSVDPISLGIIAPPAAYGADLAVGDIQSLGNHMQFGGGHAGFIASQDEERFVVQYPTRLWGIAPTTEPGEYGFGDVVFERTSFADRVDSVEWIGTTSALFGISSAVYLALLGPQGIQEVGQNILARTRYAMLGLDQIEGVRAPVFTAPHFREFVVSFEDCGKTVNQINQGLLKYHIFGGLDLTKSFPQLGSCALFCVTEIHSQEDIDRLIHAVREVASQ